MSLIVEKNIKKIVLPLSLGIPVLLIGIFLMLSIIGYNKDDASFNKVAKSETQNLAGDYGAYIADPLIQSFGFTIFLPICFILAIGYKVIRGRPIRFFLIRLSLLLLLCPLISLLLSVLGGSSHLIHGFGGYVGVFLSNELTVRFELFKFIWPAAFIALFASFFVLGFGWKEFKDFFILATRNLILTINFITWFIKFMYVALFKVVSKASRTEIEQEEYPELPKTRVVEIVNKPKTHETKIQIQSKLKLDPEELELPSTTLLKDIPDKSKKNTINEVALSQNSKLLQKVMDDFGINGKIIKIHPGPVVTLYEFEPSAGTKSSRVIGLADDIARSMSAVSARISVISGKSTMGIELPNAHREIVYLREVLESKTYIESEDKLPLILGKSIAGEPVITDLAKMPHLLVAGTTGSGKSVAINTMILSLLYKYTPKQCRFIMIDPKMLELSVYDSIPHLLTPVVTEPKKAVVALKWIVKEMESRYKSMSMLGVRNIDGYNKIVNDSLKNGEKVEKKIQVGFDPKTGEPVFEKIVLDNKIMPYIVVIVDEMADLMIVAGKDIESSIQRLAQMARAAGIHLIMATQRPSVDVITGVIKANFPTRVSFQVTSKIDSRTILGEQGAEQLLGMGDMLYMRGGGRIERVHGPFVDDKEVEAVVSFLRNQAKPEYIESVTAGEEEGEIGEIEVGSDDDLYRQAVSIVLRDKKASTSYIQRCLRIGYNRAANLIERMEKENIISAPNHVGKREILAGGND